PFIDAVADEVGVRGDVDRVVRAVFGGLDRRVEPRGRMSEGTVHELPETLAENEGPSIPLPRIVVPPVPLEVALVSGFELRVLSGFGFDHDDPREVRLLR